MRAGVSKSGSNKQAQWPVYAASQARVGSLPTTAIELSGLQGGEIELSRSIRSSEPCDGQIDRYFDGAA
jgi:hypothetical protein